MLDGERKNIQNVKVIQNQNQPQQKTLDPDLQVEAWIKEWELSQQTTDIMGTTILPKELNLLQGGGKEDKKETL